METATKQCENCLLLMKDYLPVRPHCGFPSRSIKSVEAGTTERFAAASLVLGVVGLVIGIVPFLLPVLAIVFGKRARRVGEGELRSGIDAVASAGIALGWIGIATNVVWLVALSSILSRD